VILVLCEVGDSQRCLDEIGRVPRPGGQLALGESQRDSDFIGLTDRVAPSNRTGRS